jgi:hypothetical protein
LAERSRREGIAVVAGAFVAWMTVTWTAAIVAGLEPWQTGTWDRWDSGHYRQIADQGYTFGRCVDVPNRGPEDWCGNTAWLPGYPALMRAVSALTGAGVDTAGRWISVVALIMLLSVVWFGFLADRPRSRAIPVLLLVAVFPGSVYFGAIFPVSLACAAIVGCAALMRRERWLLAGASGFVAAASYSSSPWVAVAAIVPLLWWPPLRTLQARVAAAARVAIPSALGFLAALAVIWRATGRWDAWFRVQASYRYAPTAPWTSIGRRLPWAAGDPPWGIGAQAMLVLAIIVAVVVVGVGRWSVLDAGQRAAVVLACVLWTLPLTLGGDLSTYRSEAFVVVGAVVLVRAPSVLTWTLAAAAVPVALAMAYLFFDNVLI